MSQTPAMSKVPLFGRAWELSVSFAPNANGEQQSTIISSSAWDPESLRMVFEVNITGYSSHSAFWYAKVDIYNLSPDLAQQLIAGQGATVKLSAGYQTGTGRYNLIFEGVIYQVMFERVDVVDAKITLMCYTGLAETIGNFAVLRGDPQMTQVALIQKMCAAASTPIPIGAIDSEVLSKTSLPRARPFFGNPHRYIDGVASANNMQSWYGFDGLAVSTMNAAGDTPSIVYDGASGQIIGTPQQTQDGISMDVLLDPNLRVSVPPQIIQITNSQIRQLGYRPPGYRPYLDSNGFYLVNGIQHNGDTRGDDWHTEIIAMTSQGGKAAYIYDATNPATILDRRSPR